MCLTKIDEFNELEIIGVKNPGGSLVEGRFSRVIHHFRDGKIGGIGEDGFSCPVYFNRVGIR